MKKPYSKKLFRIIISFAFIGGAVFIYSCKKDMKTILPDKPSAPVVLSAKSWYQNAYPKKALSNQK